MTTQRLPDNAPATQLFPEFRQFYDLLTLEVAGLTEEQLDFASDRWEWAGWSIRGQVSHLAAMHLRWLVGRWGKVLFPAGPPKQLDYDNLFAAEADRWLDPIRYRSMSVLLDKIGVALDLLETVLEGKTVEDLRQMRLVHVMAGDYWKMMLQAHPDGVTVNPAHPEELTMNFEWTVRHMYFEDVTHLYNIQRLKRAQGLAAVAETPRVGYWMVDGWDRSEP